jgi:hypothetical protein
MIFRLLAIAAIEIHAIDECNAKPRAPDAVYHALLRINLQEGSGSLQKGSVSQAYNNANQVIAGIHCDPFHTHELVVP